MRSLLVVLALSGCEAVERHTISEPEEPPPPAGGGGKPPTTWVEIHPTSPFGVGMTYELGFNVGHRDVPVEITVDDPEIVTVERIEIERVALHGHRAGTTTMRARLESTQALLDEATLVVSPVGAIELKFRSAPGLDAPVTALAALANTTDSLAVVYRSDKSEMLAGYATYSGRGAITIASMSELRFFDLYAPHERVHIAAGSPGAGALVVTLADDRELVFPIEVVSTVASYELVNMIGTVTGLEPLPPTVPIKVLLGSDVIARTADGRLIAGATAAWNGPPEISMIGPGQPRTEVVFWATAPGVHRLTATVGTTTLERDITFD